jgi:hypothetical protein
LPGRTACASSNGPADPRDRGGGFASRRRVD